MLYSVICLNPCIDRVLTMKAPLQVDSINRVASSSAFPAGKGVNVARVLRRLVHEDDEVALYTFLGKESIERFEAVTESEGIRLHVLETDLPTRSCYKLMAPDGTMTELNESGGPYGERELQRLAEVAASIVENGVDQLVFLCGSIPQGVDKGVYNWLITLFKSCGIKVVLDCDGEALRTGVEASPFLIKPNFFELSQLAGEDFSTALEAVEYARKLSVEKPTILLCTNGGKGSFLAKDGEVWQVSCPSVSVACPTGAGDCYLAAFVAGLTESTCVSGGRSPFPSALPSEPIDGERLVKALRWGASAAAAKVEAEGTTIPDERAMRMRIDEVSVERMSV